MTHFNGTKRDHPLSLHASGHLDPVILRVRYLTHFALPYQSLTSFIVGNCSRMLGSKVKHVALRRTGALCIQMLKVGLGR